MKLIILAGGLGTRMREETEFRPKPMVEIGGKPMLWLIMKNFSHFGVTDFIVAAGYKGEQIKDYFLNYESRNKDFTIQLGENKQPVFHDQAVDETWNVTVTDTGPTSLTGERVLKASRYLTPGEKFMVTYGDGISNVNVSELINFHNQNNTLATVTSVQPFSRFGVLDLDESNRVVSFREKPQTKNWINVGYFVFEYSALEFLDSGPLEEKPLRKLSEAGELNAFKHEGFWQPMDTYREAQQLNALWDSGDVPWKVW